MSLTHIDEKERPTMVDVGEKRATRRQAKARVTVTFPPDLPQGGEGELTTKKGPVFATAIVAGVMAAKKTHELIPFCHPLPVEKCNIDIDWIDQRRVSIECTVGTTNKTGVEMEALTGASVAALTVYDMCKALSHDIRIDDLHLVSKSGGKRDFDREL